MTPPALRPENGFFIGVSCPGCGGELHLENDFFALTCPHCASVLRVSMPNAPAAYVVKPRKSKQEARFLLDYHCRRQNVVPPGPRSPMQPLFYPYWKIDAVTLKVRSSVYEVDLGNEEDPDDDRTEERKLTTINLAPFMATSPAGAPYDGIPHTLGLRTDYVTMTPFEQQTVDSDSLVFPVVQPIEHAVTLANKAATSVGRIDQNGALRNETTLFHPTGSIIYFPYYAVDSYQQATPVRFILDAVTGKVVGTDTLEDSAAVLDPAPGIEFGALSVELHRCANCGVDLPMTRSAVYQCHNCRRVQFFESHPMLSHQLRMIPHNQQQSDRLFPFWMLRVADSKILRTFFGGAKSSDRLLIPAFDMRNFESTYRLTRRISTATSGEDWQPLDDITADSAPATRSLANSLALLEILWHRELAGRDIPTRIAYAAPTVEEVSIVFVPFHSENYFFVDSFDGAVTFESASVAP